MKVRRRNCRLIFLYNKSPPGASALGGCRKEDFLASGLICDARNAGFAMLLTKQSHEHVGVFAIYLDITVVAYLKIAEFVGFGSVLSSVTNSDSLDGVVCVDVNDDVVAHLWFDDEMVGVAAIEPGGAPQIDNQGSDGSDCAVYCPHDYVGEDA